MFLLDHPSPVLFSKVMWEIQEVTRCFGPPSPNVSIFYCTCGFSEHLQSSVLSVSERLSAGCDGGVQVGVGRLLWVPGFGLGQGVHHGHVHVEIVGLLEAFLAFHTGELQLRLRLVFSHVVFERGALSTLKATHLAL